MEGVENSNAPMDVQFVATLNCPAGEVNGIKYTAAAASDNTATAVYEIDMDIDSNNDNALLPTGYTDEEDRIEASEKEVNGVKRPGKIIVSGINADTDGDDVVDFADFNIDGGKFVPVEVKLKEPFDTKTTSVTFTYRESKPEKSEKGWAESGAGTPTDPKIYTLNVGGMRLWKKDAPSRTVEDYVPPGTPLKWSDIAGESRTKILYLEYVDKTIPEAAGRQKITVGTQVAIEGQTYPLLCDDVINVTLQPVDLAVDTDRSGTVEREADSADEDKWSKKRGAIYAVNFDCDKTATSGAPKKPDAIDYSNDDGSSSKEDWTIENDLDVADITPFQIYPTALPSDYKVILKTEEAEDMRAIHLFAKIAAGQQAIWGSHDDPAKAPWAASDPNPTDNCIEISKYVNMLHPEYASHASSELGIEGLVLRGMRVANGTLDGQPGMFSGEIQFSLEIRDKDDNVVATDLSPVRLRVAPWMMISAQEPSEQIWVLNHPANVDFRSNVVDATGNYTGIGHSNQMREDVVKSNTYNNQWFQDQIEIGYTQRPGGPKTHLVFRVPYGKGEMFDWHFDKLLGRDMGTFQIGADFGVSSGDYGGNLEILAPNESNPLGLVAIGDSSSTQMRNFIHAQEFQSEVWPNTPPSSWLKVTHIDEYTSFQSDGRVLISATDQAMALLQSEIPVADRARRVFFSTYSDTWTGNVTTTAVDDPSTPSTDESITVIHTGRNHLAEGDQFEWIRFYNGNAKGHVARVTLHDGYVTVNKLPASATPSIFYTGATMEEYERLSGSTAVSGNWRKSPMKDDGFVLVKDTKFWYPFSRFGLDYDNDGMIDGMPAIITVQEVLDDPEFARVNSLIQSTIDGGERYIRAKAGDVSPRFIPLPSLFFGTRTVTGIPPVSSIAPRSAIAFNPGPTNCQPVAGNIYVPRQFCPRNATGVDFFERTIKNSVKEPIYFTDCWNLYHRLSGEVHCGSAVKRSFPTWDWWVKMNE